MSTRWRWRHPTVNPFKLKIFEDLGSWNNSNKKSILTWSVVALLSLGHGGSGSVCSGKALFPAPSRVPSCTSFRSKKAPFQTPTAGFWTWGTSIKCTPMMFEGEVSTEHLAAAKLCDGATVFTAQLPGGQEARGDFSFCQHIWGKKCGSKRIAETTRLSIPDLHQKYKNPRGNSSGAASWFATWWWQGSSPWRPVLPTPDRHLYFLLLNPD